MILRICGPRMLDQRLRRLLARGPQLLINALCNRRPLGPGYILMRTRDLEDTLVAQAAMAAGALTPAGVPSSPAWRAAALWGSTTRLLACSRAWRRGGAWVPLLALKRRRASGSGHPGRLPFARSLPRRPLQRPRWPGAGLRPTCSARPATGRRPGACPSSLTSPFIRRPPLPMRASGGCGALAPRGTRRWCPRLSWVGSLRRHV